MASLILDLPGSELGEVIELFVRREDAERALADVLADEPTWNGQLSVVSVELADGPSAGDN